VIFAILTSLMRPQKHPGPILSLSAGGFKRVGLHYIGFWKTPIANTGLARPPQSKIAEFKAAVTNLG
jgi:hypothetical protein